MKMNTTLRLLSAPQSSATLHYLLHSSQQPGTVKNQLERLVAKKTDISPREWREPSWLFPFCFQSLCQVMPTGCSAICCTDVRVVEVFLFNYWQESKPVFLPKRQTILLILRKLHTVVAARLTLVYGEQFSRAPHA